MSEKEQYINFDEYIRQGEPQKKERAEAWRVAIGLQAVDGLKTSEYLQDTARRNIEGEITIDEARELVKNSCGSVFGLYKQLIHRRKHNTFKIERYKKVQ